VAYYNLHHGTYWFQIRVPKSLQDRYGSLVRINLQTPVRAEAQSMAFRFAGDWLNRFACESLDDGASVLHPTVQPEFKVLQHGGTNAVIPEIPATSHLSSKADKQGKAGSIDELFVYWKKLNPERADSTVTEVKKALAEFKKHIKGKSIAQIERQHLVAYRDVLIEKRLARSTIGKKVGFIASLLQVAFDAGTLPQNVGRGIRIPKAKVETLVRRPFTAAELKTIFTSPIYSQNYRPIGGGGDACIWIPLIALATGARLEEICQLRTEDLWSDPVHGLILRVTDEGEEQRIKTNGSRRLIPVHSELIRAGLKSYLQIQQANSEYWLFPNLEPDHDGRRGGTFGQWFSRYLRGKQGCHIIDKRVVFHAFRHTFKTLCREAGITEEVHDALTGHVNGSVGRTYGQMPLAPLVEAIGKLKMPVNIPVIMAE
jgi:integrase